MAVREDDLDRSDTCSICRNRYQFLADEGLWNLVYVGYSVRYSVPEEITKYEMEYLFENYLKRTKPMERDLEEDGWRREAYKFSRARSKLDEFNRRMENLKKIQTTADSLKSRLNVSKSVCSVSSKLQYQLFPLEKLLNTKFQELSMLLNDDHSMDTNVNQDGEQARKSDLNKNSKGHMFENKSSVDKVKTLTELESSLDIVNALPWLTSLLKRKIHDIAEEQDVKKTPSQRSYSSTYIQEKNLCNEVQAVSVIKAENCSGDTVAKIDLRFESQEKKRQFHFSFRTELERKYNRLCEYFAEEIVSDLDLLDYGTQVLRRHSIVATRSIERVKKEVKPLLGGIAGYWERIKTKNQNSKDSHRTRSIPPLMVSLSSSSLTSSAPQKKRVAKLFVFLSLLSISQADSPAEYHRENEHPADLVKRDFECVKNVFVVFSDVEERRTMTEQEVETWKRTKNNTSSIAIKHCGSNKRKTCDERLVKSTYSAQSTDDLSIEELLYGVWIEPLLEETTDEQTFKVTRISWNSTGLLKDCDYMTVAYTLMFELGFLMLLVLVFTVYMIEKFGIHELAVGSIVLVSFGTIIYLNIRVKENTDEDEEQNMECDATKSCQTLCSLIGSFVTYRCTDIFKPTHATRHELMFRCNDYDISIQLVLAYKEVEPNVYKDFEKKYLRSNASMLNKKILCERRTCQLKDAVVPSQREEIATSKDKQIAEDIESSSDTEEPFESDTEERFESDTMKKENLSRDELLWKMNCCLIIIVTLFIVFPNSKIMNQPWAPNKEIKDLSAANCRIMPQLYIDVPELATENEAVVAEETRLPSCISCEHATHEQLYAADVFCVREKDRLRAPENEYHEVQFIDGSEEEITFDETKPTDNEPFEAAGDNVDIHDRGMTKVYIPSKDEDIIFEYSAQTRKQTDVNEYDVELKQEKDENNFDDYRQRQRTLVLPKEWMACNRHSQPSVRNLSKGTYVMTEIEKKYNGDVDVSILIPSTPEIPHTCGASLPIDDAPTTLEADKKTDLKKPKLRMQVVPDSSLQHNTINTESRLSKPESKSGIMFHMDETFQNLKYKVKADKSRKKTPDYTVKESEFHLFALRNVAWLPLNELPVPWIDLTVAFAPQFDPIMVIIDQIANGTPPTPHISMRYELLRFCTLRSYPKDNKPFIIKLAEAGFYYASDGDGVVCYCCGIRRYNWVEEDIPMKIHKRVNPNCKFLKKNEEVNVPVQYYGPYGEALMAIMDIPEPVEREDRSEDVNNDWAPERVSSTPPQQNRRSESAANSLGINTAIPKHTQYATKTARVGSYSGWPDTASHTPEVLADAGFFYAGFGDCVRCFFCGIGLRHWTKEDDPWVEHARWARNCVFVKQKKGEDFVNLVQMSVQYSQDNETQSNTNAGNQLPAQEVERLLLSDASQSVLEMGYQPRIIKKAIEQILRQNGNAKITAQIVMEKVLEIEEAENPLQVAPAEQAAAAAPAPAQTTKPNHEKTAEGGKDSAQSKVEKKPDAARASTEPKDKDKKESKVSDEASQDPKVIKAENEQLKEQTLCKVCLDNTVCIVFLPCGHLVTCADCAPAMRKCPICRALVKGTVRTYMS